MASGSITGENSLMASGSITDENSLMASGSITGIISSSRATCTVPLTKTKLTTNAVN